MLKKVIIGIVATCVIGFAIIVGVVFFSPLPFKAVAGILAEQGVVMTGVGGSLNSGMSVEKFQFSNDKVNVELNGAKILWSNFFKNIGNKKFAVELLETQSGTIEFTVVKQEQNPTAQGAQPDPATPQNELAVDETNPKNELEEFILDQVRIKNVLVRDLTRNKEYRLDDFTLDNFWASKKEFSLEKLLVASSQFDMIVKGASFKNEVFQLTDPIKGTLKTAFSEEWIKSEIKFSVKVKMKGKMPEEVEVAIFNDKVKLNGGAQALNFQTVDFSPSDFIKTAFPLKQLNLNAKQLSMIQVASGQLGIEGTFKLVNSEFKVATVPEGLQGIFEKNGKTYTIRLPMQNLLGAAMSGAAVKLELWGSVGQELQGDLAQLMFEKDFAQISEEEKKQLETSSVFFASPVGVSAPTPVAQVSAVEPVAKEVNRSPAGMKTKKKALGAKKSKKAAMKKSKKRK